MLLAVAKRRLQGRSGAARGVCSHTPWARRAAGVPRAELRRLAGYDQTLARRGSFCAPAGGPWTCSPSLPPLQH